MTDGRVVLISFLMYHVYKTMIILGGLLNYNVDYGFLRFEFLL